jgi:hypothetical protein
MALKNTASDGHAVYYFLSPTPKKRNATLDEGAGISTDTAANWD